MITNNPTQVREHLAAMTAACAPKVVLIYDSGDETVINVTRAEGHVQRVLDRESLRIGRTYDKGTVVAVMAR